LHTFRHLKLQYKPNIKETFSYIVGHCHCLLGIWYGQKHEY